MLLIDRALELDENLAAAWQRSGWVCGYAGDSEGAIESLNRAIRLNPLDPRVFLTQSAMAFAHFIAGRDEEAADWAAMALRVKPNWLPALRVAIACQRHARPSRRGGPGAEVLSRNRSECEHRQDMRILSIAPGRRSAAADPGIAQSRPT